MSAAAMTLPAQLFLETRTRTGKPDPMDEARFETFYRRTAGGLWSYLYRMTGDAAAADDLLQKSFFRLIRSNPTLESEQHMRRWMFRTATNLALDHFRETKRERSRSEEPVRAPIAAAEPREGLRHDMMKVFSELKPQERALLWLAHVEEANHADIGDALGLGTKSVKVLLFRARKRLGDLLTKKGLAPEVKR